MLVVLIGYRGSGKTRVGRIVAKKLSIPFVDTDEYIEQKTGLSIAEIFARCGESYFRDLESQAIADVTKNDAGVIATGGGAVLRYKNIQHLKRNGIVIHLDVGSASAADRIRQDPQTRDRRPPLREGDLEDVVRDEIQQRTPYYAAAADFRVLTDNQDPEGTAQVILEWLWQGPLKANR